jgi:cytochrome c-type biogenesis protein CcmH
MRWLCLVVALLSLVALPPAIAVVPDEILSDAALEARARALSKELRCMVCQNQSIDDSDAPLARDLRILVRERLQAGESDRQVIDFLVARYGELLWLAPAAMLLIAACGLPVFARRRQANSDRATAEREKLTPAEAARLSEILRRAQKMPTVCASSGFIGNPGLGTEAHETRDEPDRSR